jgi:hypothetical protein
MDTLQSLEERVFSQSSARYSQISGVRITLFFHKKRKDEVGGESHDTEIEKGPGADDGCLVILGIKSRWTCRRVLFTFEKISDINGRVKQSWEPCKPRAGEEGDDVSLVCGTTVRSRTKIG